MVVIDRTVVAAEANRFPTAKVDRLSGPGIIARQEADLQLHAGVVAVAVDG